VPSAEAGKNYSPAYAYNKGEPIRLALRGSGILDSGQHRLFTAVIPCIGSAHVLDGAPFLPDMTIDQPDSLYRFAAVKNLADVSHISHIELKGIKDGQTTFYDTLFVEGTVRTTKGIKDITINGQSFLALEEDESVTSFLKNLIEKKKRSLTFSKIIKLREGENTLTIALEDASGKITKKTCTIIRKIPRVRQIGSRLTITIYPFKEEKKMDEPLESYVQTFLTNAFVNQQRFNILERTELNKLLDEQEISQEAIFDQMTAIRLGRLMASEAVLLGDIFASAQSVEIIARMVDTETSLILAEKDVYWEGRIRAGFREILEGLALKFQHHFPLCEGTVINEKSGKVIINLGRNKRIFKGMRFLAFRESSPVVDPDTGSELGRDTEILGLVAAKEISDKFSKGEVLKKFTERRIKAGHRVITK
jgi:hypothetical protein